MKNRKPLRMAVPRPVPAEMLDMAGRIKYPPLDSPSVTHPMPV